MARSISLTRTPQKLPNQSYKYHLVSVGTETPDEIFVIQRSTVHPLTGVATNSFSHVASPEELTTVPVGSPVAGQNVYRLAAYDFIYATRDLADDDWLVLQDEINRLVRALNAADQTLAPETVVCAG